MAQLALNQNQFAQTPVLGQVSQLPNPNIFPAQIDPADTATVITAGTAVKLSNVAGTQIVVLVCAAVTDGPVFGVIVYNMRKNTYAAGDTVEVAGVNSVITLKSSAAIARGANVSQTAPSAGNDPLITTSVVTNYVLGQALEKASGANQLIRVLVNPQPVVL